MLYSIACLWHQCACFCMWTLLWRTKEGVRRLPLVAKSGNNLPFLQCCMSVHVSIHSIIYHVATLYVVLYWLVLLLRLSVSIDPQIVGPVPFYILTKAKHSMPSSPVNCMIDKSRLSMPDYKARFILNPTNCLVQPVSVCEWETEKENKGYRECTGSECVLYYKIYALSLAYVLGAHKKGCRGGG